MTLAALLLLAATPLPTAIPNPGFEHGLEGWRREGNRGYFAFRHTSNAGRSHLLSISWGARNMPAEDAEFQVNTRIDARRYRGRLIRISASVRVYGRREGEAVIFARAGAAEAATPLEPDRPWERRAVDLAVPRDAREIMLGFHIRRSGVRIEADDVMLEVMP